MFDTAATAHVMNSASGASKTDNRDKSTVLANRSIMKTKQVGDFPLQFFDKNGKQTVSMVLTDATISPGGVNLFASSRMLLKGWTQGGNEHAMWVTNGKTTLMFDIVLKMSDGKGAVYCAKIKPQQQELATAVMQHEVAAAGLPTIQQIHSRLGHCGEAATKAAAKHLGIQLAPGEWSVCESCAIGKAKQKNIPKTTELESRDDADEKRRVYSDIASIKNKEGQVSVLHRHWHMLVCGGYGKKHSSFHTTKGGIVESTCAKLQMWQSLGLGVDIVRMDNAKENKKLKARMESADWKLPIEVEFTARATPQQNSPVETGFATVANRARAMVAAAKVPEIWLRKMFILAANCATDVDGLMIVKWKGKVATRDEHWCGKIPAFAKHLRTWGEAGVATVKTTRTTKVDARGQTCMMVGYAKAHDGNVYMMYNLNTGVIYETRDVVWLKRMYFTGKEDVDGQMRKEMRDVQAATNHDDVEFEEQEGAVDGSQTVAIPAAKLTVPEEKSASKMAARSSKAFSDMSDYNKAQVKSLADTIRQRVTTRSGRVVVPTEKAVQWQSTLFPAEAAKISDETAEEVEEEEIVFDDSDMSDDQAHMMFTLDPEEVELGDAEEIFYDALADIGSVFKPDISCVGAGLGGGFSDTSELHVMKYDEAMHMADPKDVEEWHDAVAEEKNRMDEHKVWEAVPMTDGAFLLGDFEAELNMFMYIP
jgi:hypothetical protein